ncbi:MAG: DUF2384 domain-containing protein [Proteobacteria bacterium]|nr:DUF2384 domain-containing protein [Pseudomonadota bacterium]
MRRPVIEVVAEKLGGRENLGVEVVSDAELARVVTERLPLATLRHVHLRCHLSKVEVEGFVIAPRTRRHRARRAEPLNVEESDRLVRLARIQTLAEQVFEDPEKANQWLREPLGILGGQPPLAYARTDAGSRVIEQILAKIDWGAAA